jgi:hypothetical protein
MDDFVFSQVFAKQAQTDFPQKRVRRKAVDLKGILRSPKNSEKRKEKVPDEYCFGRQLI